MDDAVNDALRLHPQSECLVEKFNIGIKRADMNKLSGLNLLNDEVRPTTTYDINLKKYS